MIRLLVVDDAPFIREIVGHAVSGSGIEVVGEAADGIEAVEKCRTLKPEVVLMDIVLPSQNGIDATRLILDELPETRVVAFSTSDDDVMVMRALEAGCCSFVAKPFEAEVLIASIKQALSRNPGISRAADEKSVS